jgi:hypothetical protein
MTTASADAAAPRFFPLLLRDQLEVALARLTLGLTLNVCGR